MFERISTGWTVESRTFWRPALDPALLIADLPFDEAGRPHLPARREFWDDVFAEDARRRAPSTDSRTATEPESRVDFAWLADRVFQGDALEHRRRYHQVLFASRVLPAGVTEMDEAAVAAVRAIGSFPALVAVLERMGIRDPAVYARAAARAARLSEIDDDARALRSLTQFQGLLALLARASARGSIPPDRLAGDVISLVDVEVTRKGDYAGQLVRWLDEHLRKASGATGRRSRSGARRCRGRHRACRR